MQVWSQQCFFRILTLFISETVLENELKLSLGFSKVLGVFMQFDVLYVSLNGFFYGVLLPMIAILA